MVPLDTSPSREPRFAAHVRCYRAADWEVARRVDCRTVASPRERQQVLVVQRHLRGIAALPDPLLLWPR
jgi:hypothetical protein